MSSPLISIVVPVYKVPEEMLRRCLRSIASQTSKNFEAIVIDDGSPDACGEICDEFSEGLENFRTIHQENGGLSVVRNNGIKEAKGEWVCFVDGDDWIEPETVAFAEQYVSDCPDGDVLIWDEYYDTKEEQKENYFLGCQTKGTLSFEGEGKQEIFDIMIPVKYVKNDLVFADIGNCHARLYNVDFLRKNQLYNQPELRRMQDNVFQLWVFEKACKIYYRCERLYHYSFNEDAATKKYNSSICENFAAVYKYMMEFADACHPEETFKQRIYSRFARLFLKVVEQKHANPNNPEPLGRRLAQMKEDFNEPWAHEVIVNIELNGQAWRVKICIWMLRLRAYLLLYLLVKGIVFTRDYRLRFR